MNTTFRLAYIPARKRRLTSSFRESRRRSSVSQKPSIHVTSYESCESWRGVPSSDSLLGQPLENQRHGRSPSEPPTSNSLRDVQGHIKIILCWSPGRVGRYSHVYGVPRAEFEPYLGLGDDPARRARVKDGKER